MMNPIQMERLCEHMGKLRLFKSRERLKAVLQQAATILTAWLTHSKSSI